MRVPVPLKIAVLAVATTGFYAYVGQLVPQKEVHPPEVKELKKDMTTEEMVATGREIFHGKGLCSTCHTIGQPPPHRFPDLANVDVRARTRVAGFSDVDYFAQTLYQPNAFIVPGFNPGMPTINKPPVGLSDQEILTVIAFLQSQGGKPTVTMATKLPYQEGAQQTSGANPASTPPGGPGGGR